MRHKQTNIFVLNTDATRMALSHLNLTTNNQLQRILSCRSGEGRQDN